eukprot:jgi/Chlat1/7852/Chrsp66S07298
MGLEPRDGLRAAADSGIDGLRLGVLALLSSKSLRAGLVAGGGHEAPPAEAPRVGFQAAALPHMEEDDDDGGDTVANELYAPQEAVANAGSVGFEPALERIREEHSFEADADAEADPEDGYEAGDEGSAGVKAVVRYFYELGTLDASMPEGFYDVPLSLTNKNYRRLPPLDVLQRFSPAPPGEEVLVVDPRTDVALARVRKLARSMLEDAPQDLQLRRLAEVVADFFGGTHTRNVAKNVSNEASRLSITSCAVPIGQLQYGLCRPRALLFKFLADSLRIPARLFRGVHRVAGGASAPAALHMCVVVGNADNQECIIDLMRTPGQLILFSPESLTLYYAQEAQACAFTTAAGTPVSSPSVAGSTASGGSPSLQPEWPDAGYDSPRSPNSPVVFSRSLAQSRRSSQHQLRRYRRRSFSSSPDSSPVAGSPTHSDTSVRVQQTQQAAAEKLVPPQELQQRPPLRTRSFREQPVSRRSNLSNGLSVSSPLSGRRLSSPDESPSGSSDSLWGVTPRGSVDGTGLRLSRLRPLEPELHSALARRQEGTSSSDEQKSAKKGDAADDDSTRVAATARAVAAMMAATSGQPRPKAVNRSVSFFQPRPSFDLEVVERGAEPGTPPLASSPLGPSPLRSPVHDMDAVASASGRTFGELSVEPLMPFSGWEIEYADIQLGARVGTGSFGEVYRGVWRGTEVAVKLLLEQNITQEVLEDFRQEITMLSRLRHPNVILFLGACVRPPHLSIVCEYMHMGSLHRILHSSGQGHKLSWRRKLKMLRDICRGMMYLESMNIVHRDLKSANCLVDKHWAVKVCDFGLSKIMKQDTQQNSTAAGTPEWMAPELLRSERYDTKADVFSMGVIMWEMSTLKKPWHGQTPMQVVFAVSCQRRRLEIPEGPLQELIRDCWEDEPSKRPGWQDMLSRLHDIEFLVA